LADVMDRQLSQQFLRPRQHRFGHARQARHVNSVAAIRPAFDDSMQEDHLVLPLAHGHV